MEHCTLHFYRNKKYFYAFAKSSSEELPRCFLSSSWNGNGPEGHHKPPTYYHEWVIWQWSATSKHVLGWSPLPIQQKNWPDGQWQQQPGEVCLYNRSCFLEMLPTLNLGSFEPPVNQGLTLSTFVNTWKNSEQSGLKTLAELDKRKTEVSRIILFS